MTEYEKIGNQLAAEMLTRFSASSLADVSERQITAFCSSSGLSETNPAWQIVLRAWTALHGGDVGIEADRIRAKRTKGVTMTDSELAAQTDENLFSLLTRGGDESVRRNAAYELYVRKSRFLATPEFQDFKQYCVRKELQAAASGQAVPDPTRAVDGLGELYQTTDHLAQLNEANQSEIARVDEDLSTLNALTAESLQAMSNATEGMSVALTGAIDALLQAHTATTKKFLIWLALLSTANVAAIVFQFLHHAR